MALDILIVDDEADIREVIADLLQDEGYETRGAEDGEKAIEAITQRRPNLIILDIWLGNSRFDGIKVLEILQRENVGIPVIMMSGHGNIETAVNAIKMGAYDYIEKPFKADRLLLVMQRALEATKLRRENDQLKLKIAPDTVLVGQSSYITNLKHTIEKISGNNSRVFIMGPSGTGKEVIARQIHDLSPRPETGAFIIFNCATTSLEKFEEELFGREEKGKIIKIGVLEQAHGGTLMLDEITDMPLASQSRLARIVQENLLRRDGGEKPIQIDVRMITTSSRSVERALQHGVLREELYYRLNVVPLHVCALRERVEDIPLLADHFLERYSKGYGHPKKILSEDAITALQAYDWPGNIRQLRNVIEWVLIMASAHESQVINLEMLPPEVTSSLPVTPDVDGVGEILKLPLKEARDMFEKQYLLSQVSRFAGNISQTANFVGMERSALHRKLKSLGLKRTGTE